MENIPLQTETVNLSAKPIFFDVTRKKMIVMNLSTLGLYYLYWMYKNWVIVKETEKTKIKPFWRAFFCVLYTHSLYDRLSSAAIKEGFPKFTSSNLALIFVLGTVMANASARLDNQLGAFLWFVWFIVFYPISKMQTVVQYYNRQVDAAYSPKASYSLFEKFIVTIGVPWSIFTAISVGAQLFGLIS